MIPASALEQHIGVLGKTGAGKSFAAKGIVEGILDAGGRVCAIDPTGVWAGLRTNAKGDGPGYPVVILGGKNGDVPIGRTEGAMVAHAVGTSSTSFVIDMLTLSHGAKVEFFRDFAHALLSENEGVLHLVIDEAHDFAPQSGSFRDPAAADMLHAANNLVAQGRARGLRVMLLTQRPAKLHKDSLSQVESLIAMRVTAPQDRKPIEDWMVGFYGPSAARDVAGALAGLKTGEGFIAANGAAPVRITFPPIKSFDSGRPGAHAQRPLAPVNVEALREALAPAVESGTHKGPARAKQIAAADIEAAERRGYERGLDEGLARGAARCIQALTRADSALQSAITEVAAGLEAARAEPCSPVTPLSSSGRTPAFEAENRGSIPRGGAKARAAETANPAAKNIPQNIPGGLTGPQRQLLSALAFWSAIGIAAPTRAQVAPVAGWKITSGHLKNVAGSLRTLGLIEYPAEGAIGLTEAGREAAPNPDMSVGLIERIRGVMTGPQREAFEVLLRADGSDGLSREQIALRAGWNPTSGHVKNVLGSLRTLDVITYPRAGYVSLSPWIAEARGAG